MYPRTNYEMTEADLEKILDACKPTPVMKIGNYFGSSPQENANAAWAELGKRMGFDYMTVQPTSQGNRFFTAIPSETEDSKAARLKSEAFEKRQSEIVTLRQEIRERTERLEALGSVEAEKCELVI